MVASVKQQETETDFETKSMDHAKFSSLIENMYSMVNELETMFPGRPFTPDGHMVGSIGECLVADAYNLTLMPPSNKGYDAKSQCGKNVEIKATQSKSVAFRSCPEHTIIIKINKNGSFTECYNGPGVTIWKCFEGKTMPTNGQFQISVNKLKDLNNLVSDNDRINRIKQLHTL